MGGASDNRDFSETIRRSEKPPAPKQRLTLRVVGSTDKNAVGRTFELDGETWTFGRAVEGPGLLSDGLLSREHLEFRPVPKKGIYEVADLGSSNGSFLNGVRLSDASSLEPNAVIAAGDTVFVVDAELPRGRFPASNSSDADAAH